MAETVHPPSSDRGDSPFLVRRTPRAELAGMVSDIVGYRENGRPLAGQVEMAALVVPLVISFGEAFTIALGRKPTDDDTYASFTSGLYAGHVVIASGGRAECIQIDFTPLGAYRFFRLPMSELAGRMVTLDDLEDRHIARLRQRLGEQRNWMRRLDLAEKFVMARLHGAPPPDRALDWAYRQIRGSHGRVRIGRLASELDWSRKHLSQRFKEQLGMGPKAIARMVRFHNALALARRGASPDWADIAADCGYADQAHLAREFSQFAGASPTRLQAKA